MKTLRLLLIVGGILLTLLGLHELLIARAWKSQPHVMTCAELARQGAGGNAHLRLVDFILAIDEAVCEDGPEGVWSRVWIPALPKQQEAVPAQDPTDFRVLVRSRHVGDRAALERLAGATLLDGFVVNDIERLGEHDLRRLEDAYPHTQIDRCWILDHGRQPMSSMTAEVLVAGGLLLFGLGYWLLVRRRRRSAGPLDAIAPGARE